MDTRYFPATAGALAIGGSVAFGLFLTHNPNCLGALFFVIFLDRLMPPLQDPPTQASKQE